MFSPLTGGKLDTESLLSVYISKEETLLVLHHLEIFPFNMLLLIALDNGVLKISADN